MEYHDNAEIIDLQLHIVVLRCCCCLPAFVRELYGACRIMHDACYKIYRQNENKYDCLTILHAHYAALATATM